MKQEYALATLEKLPVRFAMGGEFLAITDLCDYPR